MSRTKAFTASLLLLAALFTASCGGLSIQPVATRTLMFEADKHINYDQLLPVDIIYVSYLHDLKNLVAIGPKQWFNSPQRKNWPAKQSIGILGGQNKTIDLNPLLAGRSPFILIFCTFKGVSDPAAQQVVLDSRATDIEIIKVRAHSLEPLNKLLREYD